MGLLKLFILPSNLIVLFIVLGLGLHLYFSDLAVNEYAGLLWYKLTGKI